MVKGSKYWETQPTAVLEMDDNKLRWFKEEGVLQVSRPDYIDGAGEKKPGKTVALRLPQNPEHRRHLASLLSEVVAGLCDGA